jgi:hypothetical protein
MCDVIIMPDGSTVRSISKDEVGDDVCLCNNTDGEISLWLSENVARLKEEHAHEEAAVMVNRKVGVGWEIRVIKGNPEDV